ncbi:MAG: protein kinase [Planctomyces sp.]|nr:protein kinase [Planctomyces sp.]
MNEREIFEAAIELEDPVARREFLERACGSDKFLRARVESLLNAHHAAGNFLKIPVAGALDPTLFDESCEKPGTQIGAYKLLQQLGEGGMGVVYMAEQKEPIHRRVALKIIKPGMDSRQVVARFEAERQALAMMDHPNIAKVFDAGTTTSGRPFFVMELVNGVPITEYCDDHHLTARERLELFTAACDAIQHAHQKGVIHRDLKPGNILVASYDGRPVPKVIDFGIAKATGQQLTERTLFTALGQIVGTIEYMSPEQATRNQLDVDTRSDVYSLGVVLYELLTGETPLDRQRLRTAAWDEMLRMIREDEPQRPSARLSSSERRASIAASRGTEPARLSAIIRGELDWIVIKALEKDRTRRYESSSQFAADIRRYLAHEAVTACPPSAIYRFRKFVRRNFYTMAFLFVTIITLVAGLAGTAWQAHRARVSEKAVRESLVAETDARKIAISEQENARQSQLETEVALNTASRRLSQMYIERGLASIDTNPHAGLPWLTHALTVDTSDTSTAALNRLRLTMIFKQVPTLRSFSPGASVWAVAEEQKLLAIVQGNDVRIYTLPDLRLKSTLSHDARVESITFSRTGDRIATLTGLSGSSGSTGMNPSCRIWDPRTGVPQTNRVDLSDTEFQMRELPSIQFTPDGKSIVAVYAGLYNRWHSKVVVRVFDSQTLKQINRTFAHHSDLDYTNGYHELSPDLTRILVPRGTTADDPRANWSEQGDVPEGMDRAQQYDLMTGAAIHAPLASVSNGYTYFEYNRDGTQIATTREAGVVKLWDGLTGELQREISLSADSSYASVWFHPDNQHLILIEPGEAVIYDRTTGIETSRKQYKDKFELSSTGKYCAYLDQNGTHYLELLMTVDGSESFRPLPDFDQIRFSDDDEFLLVQQPAASRDVGGQFLICQDDHGIWVWDMSGHRELVEQISLEHGGEVIDAAFSRERDTVYALSDDNWLQAIDTETLQPRFQPLPVPAPPISESLTVWDTIVSDDAQSQMALGGVAESHPTPETQTDLRVIQIWDLKSRRPKFQPLVFNGDNNTEYSAPFFSRDGRTLFVPQTTVVDPESPDENGERLDTTLLHIIDVDSGTPRREPVTFRGHVTFLELATDGKRCLVTCEASNYYQLQDHPPFAAYAQLFDTATWEPLTPPMTPSAGNVENAVLTPDNSRLIMGNAEVWDPQTGLKLLPALISHQTIHRIDVASDSRSFSVIVGGDNPWVDRTFELRLFSIGGEPMVQPMVNMESPGVSCARHPHMDIIAVAGDKLRLWDVKSGLALSASLPFPVNGNQLSNETPMVLFSPAGRHLILKANQQLLIVRINELIQATVSDAELQDWASLLSGHRIDDSGGKIPLNATELDAIWRRLQASTAREN